MFLKRDKAAWEQRGSVAFRLTPVVKSLFRFQPKFCDLLSIVLLGILARIVVDFELRFVFLVGFLIRP